MSTSDLRENNETIDEEFQRRASSKKDGAAGDKKRLPTKTFIARESVLTELLELNHFRALYHIFVAVLLLMAANSLVSDLFDGRVLLHTDLVVWSFGGLPDVIMLWLGMSAATIYLYYVFSRYLWQEFDAFRAEHATLKNFVISVFHCMLPGGLILLIGFFAILHSWHNAFAEMLRFADRLFYKDWWNSTSFSGYYRTWNVIVHDWLYSYIYLDFHNVVGASKTASAASVFFISAIFHEYIIILAFRFFYPVLFVMFMGGGFALAFLNGRSRGWNVFLWWGLFFGLGIVSCLYSMEWYARKNCPYQPGTSVFVKYMLPRTFTCGRQHYISDW